jgi:hypothetical protein
MRNPLARPPWRRWLRLRLRIALLGATRPWRAFWLANPDLAAFGLATWLALLALAVLLEVWHGV